MYKTPKICLVGNSLSVKEYAKFFDKNNIRYQLTTMDSWRDVIATKSCDGVIAASSNPNMHVTVAEYALSYRTPVLVENPAAFNIQDIEKLRKLEFNAPMLVNYMYLLSPIFAKLTSLINIGTVSKVVSMGYDLGPFKKYSPLFDYATHDLAMGIYLFGGVKDIKSKEINGILLGENYQLSIEYDNLVTHEALVGNLGPDKKRYFEVNDGDNKIIYDEMAYNKLTMNGSPIEVNNESSISCITAHFIDIISGHSIPKYNLSLTEKVIDAILRVRKI